jgi:hypothetical protein
MKERHWISLVTNLQHGQCILVFGPEIGASPASNDVLAADTDTVSYTEALTRRLAEELEEDGGRRVTGVTLAAVAQQYEDAQGFGTNALRALAETFYTSGAYVPSDVHDALAALPFSLILTTCHDDLLTRALDAAGKRPLVQRYHLRGDRRENPEFMVPGTPETPLIYHLFGEAHEPGSMVLSENDVLDFLIAIISERPPLPHSLSRALKRNGQSFLFVGFGIRHWYLRVLLKVVVRALGLHRTGSAIAAEPLRGLTDLDREQTILFYQRGTRVEVEDADTSDFLTELSRRLAASGGYLAKARPSGPRAKVFISYAREDEQLAARLFDALQRSHFEPWLDTEALRGGDDWDGRIKDELEATDFVLVLYTPALCRKADSYVNREIALARDRALAVRGRFLLPLRSTEIAAEDRIHELREYQDELLRPAFFDEDMARVISILLRDYQRRSR